MKMINVISTKRAVGANEAQSLRLAHSDAVPIGDKIVATLNGKSWGKATNLLCYFTEENTGSRFTISVFRSRENGKTYCADDQIVDFSEPNIEGNKYILNINQSPRAKYPKLKQATLFLS